MKEDHLKHIDTDLWVDEYSDMLYNYAQARVSDHDLSLDLVQDTFISALKALENFEGKSTIKTWLFSILKRKIIDHWRKQDSRKTRPMSSYFAEGSMGPHFLEPSSPKGLIPEFEEKINNEELGGVIQECIDDLPGKQKGIILDKLVQEKDSEEVCKDYDISASNLWVIVHRAKLQLRECLESKWVNS